MAYGKIKNGVIVYAPDTYESSVIRIDGFNNDINLMKEFGYKEVVESGNKDDKYVTKKVIEELEDKISIYYEVDNSKEIVEVIKASRIEKTRANLAEYLELNPLYSSVKDGIELPYTVTLEKQTQLTATMSDFISKALPYILQALFSGSAGGDFNSFMDSLPFELSWNSQGETCKKWTYSEMFELKNEMMAYVKPIVEYQRYLEKLITNFSTQEEVLDLDISFTRDKIDAYVEILRSSSDYNNVKEDIEETTESSEEDTELSQED